jgi:hypothetical protein
MKVHSVKIVGVTADKTISFVAVGNLTEHDQPVGTPPEIDEPEGGTPEQPIYTPPPKPTPHK